MFRQFCTICIRFISETSAGDTEMYETSDKVGSRYFDIVQRSADSRKRRVTVSLKYDILYIDVGNAKIRAALQVECNENTALHFKYLRSNSLAINSPLQFVYV